MNSLSCSVAVATYNGEKYILEQLESICNQSRKPDEVIICDDRSCDRTYSIIEEYINSNNLNTTWQLKKNKTNKGYARNFIECAMDTKSDIIFYCDQDDIWDLHKIESMMAVLESDASADAVHCFTLTIDGTANHQRTLFDLYKTKTLNGKIERVDLTEMLRYGRSAGLCLAFRRKLLSNVNRWNLEFGIPHDLPVGYIASLQHGYRSLNSALVRRRITGDNLSRPHKTLRSRISDPLYQIDSNKNNLKVFNALLHDSTIHLSSEDHELVQRGYDLLEESIDALSRKNILKLFTLIFRRCSSVDIARRLVNLFCAIFGKYEKSAASE